MCIRDSSSDEEDDDMLGPNPNYPTHSDTAAEAATKAKQTLTDLIQGTGPYTPKPKAKSKTGSSADAVKKAKDAVWADHHEHEEDWSQEGYYDKKGYWHPFNSGVSQAKGKGKGRGKSKDHTFSNVSEDYLANSPWSEWKPINHSLWGNGREWWEEGNYNPEVWDHHYPRSKRGW
eukprot:2788059-Alexandrium_andersonii.AAC.1